MTAIEKLKAAFAGQSGRNVDLHEQLVTISMYSMTQGDIAPCDVDDLLCDEPTQHGAPVEEADDYEPTFLTVFDVLEAIREIEELEKREPLPFKQEITDPHQAYFALMAEWQNDKANLAYYKEQEASKRMLLFNGAFPNPKEGTNKLLLSDGRTIKATYPIGRKIDEAALPVTLATMREHGVANADALVRYKPELAKREWNTLSEDNKLLFSPCVIATPGMPQLEIIEAKAPKR